MPAGSLRQARAEALYRRFSGAGRRRARWRRCLAGGVWLVAVQLLGGAKRALDFTLALLILLPTAWWWVRLMMVLRATGGALERAPRVGRWGQVFQRYSFRTSGRAGRIVRALHLAGFPVLFNILKGDMSFVGPRAVAPGELSPRDRLARRRYDVRPGLICLWWLRQRANIAYDCEALADAEYAAGPSVLGDLSLALRAIPAVLYGQGAASAPDLLSVAGIAIHNLTMAEAVETIAGWCSGTRARQVCFVNADCVNIAWRDAGYCEALRSADLVLADGIGMKLAGKLLGAELKQNVNGTDLFPRLCEALAGGPSGVFLLGGRPGVPEAVRGWLAAQYPALRVCGCRHGYFAPEEEPAVIEEIRASGAALLLVALGAPRQDLWVRACAAGCGAAVAMGVGGLFDFYSRRIPRAPQWMREMGLEWVYRLYQEPGRMWKRYLLGNFLFLLRVMKVRWRRPAVSEEGKP